MSALLDPRPTGELPPDHLLGTARPSPAGPIDAFELAKLPRPPALRLPRFAQVVWFGQRQTSFVFRNRDRFGEVWRVRGYVRGTSAITSHPDHVRSLFTASPELVPTLAAESPLRPVLGPRSVLTANGSRHLRQRKLLLPSFHGDAIARYEHLIRAAAEREIARWPLRRPFALAPRMQSITLDVIMGGIFGILGRPDPGTLEHALRTAVRGLLRSSTLPGAKLAELTNIGHDEPVGLTRLALKLPDRLIYALIHRRRHAADLADRRDILSLLMTARAADGEALSDEELRDELMTLVLAGHETTANQLAWTWERLVRSPAAYQRLRDTVRAGDDSFVEPTLVESMRCRPVIPMTGRRVSVPWRLGPYGVPADTGIAISILLLHHRHDVYPDPFAFRPERWIDRKPGTYEWIPFGGGTRRCLGATLAMAEQRIVLSAMARTLDLEPADPRPERPKHRNVTMIPAHGGRVIIRRGRRGHRLTAGGAMAARNAARPPAIPEQSS